MQTLGQHQTACQTYEYTQETIQQLYDAEQPTQTGAQQRAHDDERTRQDPVARTDQVLGEVIGRRDADPRKEHERGGDPKVRGVHRVTHLVADRDAEREAGRMR